MKTIVTGKASSYLTILWARDSFQAKRAINVISLEVLAPNVLPTMACQESFCIRISAFNLTTTEATCPFSSFWFSSTNSESVRQHQGIPLNQLSTSSAPGIAHFFGAFTK